MEGYIIDSCVIKKLEGMLYCALVVCLSSESPSEILHKIDNSLMENNLKGKVLIDCLLHNGNNSNRFVEIEFDESFISKSAKIVILERGNYYREYSTKILSSYPNIIKNSMLNKYQKNLIFKITHF